MRLGDRVMTPEGEGILGDLHRYGSTCPVTLNSDHYYMYAVHVLSLKIVRYFLPEEVTPFQVDLESNQDS